MANAGAADCKPNEDDTTPYPLTYGALMDVFIEPLTEIIIEYFGPKDGSRPAFYGAFELCVIESDDGAEYVDIEDTGRALRDACEGGHIEIARRIKLGGSAYIHMGMVAAAANGHLELVRSMACRGGDDVAMALVAACRGGHVEIARYLLKFSLSYGPCFDACWYPDDMLLAHRLLGGHPYGTRQATDNAIDVSFTIACIRGHQDIINLLLDRDDEPHCLCGRDGYDHRDTCVD